MNTDVFGWEIQFEMHKVKEDISLIKGSVTCGRGYKKSKHNNPEQSLHLVNPIIQTWKYETRSDFWHWPFITWMCRSYQMNWETPARRRHFSHLCLHFSTNPSSFSQWTLFSPCILLNLPSFQFNPNSPSSPYITQSARRWKHRLMGWVFPGADLFLTVSTQAGLSVTWLED